jgi:hypothetical protein
MKVVHEYAFEDARSEITASRKSDLRIFITFLNKDVQIVEQLQFV